MVTFDYFTPDTGYEPNVMELTGTNELNNEASSDIYFQDSLEDTALFRPLHRRRRARQASCSRGR